MKKLRISPNFIISLVLTALVVLFAGFFGDYYFDLNDDVLMKDILSGAYTGTPAGHNIQMLYPVSAFIALLYRVNRGLDWYGIFLCFCQYLCVFIIFHRSLKMCVDNVTKVVVAIMELGMMLGAIGSHFVFVQYTFTCGFLSAVAVFLIMTNGIGDSDTSGRGSEVGKRDFILPVFLILLAYLIRSEMLLLTLPMVGVGILAKWWLTRLTMGSERDGAVEISNYGRRKELFIRYVKLCVAIVICLAVSAIAHRIAYSPEDWKEFNRLFDARTELYDFQFAPDYDENKDFYDSIGLDKSEYQLLINYNIGLDEEIGADVMWAVAEYAASLREDAIPLPRQLINAIPSYLYRLRHVALQYSYQYPMTDFPWNVITGVLYLSVLLLGLFSQNRERKLPMVAILILLFACRSSLWLYIIVRGRDPVRITHPMYLVEMMILTGIMLSEFGRSGRKVLIPVLAVALVTELSVPNQINVISYEMEDRANMRQHYGALYTYFSDNPNNFYFVDVYSNVNASDAVGYYEASFAEKMFEDVDNSEANHDLMGGWGSKSPLYYQKLKNNGFGSMEVALLQDNVYMVQLVGKDTDWIRDYYADKYIDVTVTQEDLVGDVFAIYSIRR